MIGGWRAPFGCLPAGIPLGRTPLPNPARLSGAATDRPISGEGWRMQCGRRHRDWPRTSTLRLNVSAGGFFRSQGRE